MRIATLILAGTATLLLAGAGPAVMAQSADQKDQKEKSDDKINDGDRALDTVENIATRPLKDMNIVKKKIPPELEAMMEKPYSLTGLKTCRQLIAEVKKINGLVGPDVDSPEALAENKQTPAEFVFGAGEALAGSLIPFSGLVRFVSGAQKRERYAQAAVFAGSVRRAYLKGTARNRGCKGI
ncbi:hypothetical protein [Polymorphobacter sp.]|uniref:hypothetical protein n=1 Tax=Polymorphobacter sp. TaxID=1909290 RepID=UPI003F713C3D